jgi:membrane protease YdiL (CAAX protease family)
LLVACAAAMISPRPFARRLSLGTGVMPFWTWIVFLVGTPIVGIVSSEILSLFVDDLSDNLKLIESMMRSHLVRSLPLLLVLVAVVPGVVEEIMFRGYLQTRLAERWSPVWAIAVSAVIFSAAHMDPLHGIGVLPLGLWLGAVAWRTASVWPAVLCHTVNNAVAVIGLKLQPDEKIGVAMDNVTLVVLMVCGPAFLFSLYLFRNR